MKMVHESHNTDGITSGDDQHPRAKYCTNCGQTMLVERWEWVKVLNWREIRPIGGYIIRPAAIEPCSEG